MIFGVTGVIVVVVIELVRAGRMVLVVAAVHTGLLSLFVIGGRV